MIVLWACHRGVTERENINDTIHSEKISLVRSAYISSDSASLLNKSIVRNKFKGI
jgi:hypothetical protein